MLALKRGLTNWSQRQSWDRLKNSEKLEPDGRARLCPLCAWKKGLTRRGLVERGQKGRGPLFGATWFLNGCMKGKSENRKAEVPVCEAGEFITGTEAVRARHTPCGQHRGICEPGPRSRRPASLRDVAPALESVCSVTLFSLKLQCKIHLKLRMFLN